MAGVTRRCLHFCRCRASGYQSDFPNAQLADPTALCQGRAHLVVVQVFLSPSLRMITAASRRLKVMSIDLAYAFADW